MALYSVVQPINAFEFVLIEQNQLSNLLMKLCVKLVIGLLTSSEVNYNVINWIVLLKEI